MTITTYTRGNGEVVEIKAMSDFHLLAAIRKLRKCGAISARDQAVLMSCPDFGPEEIPESDPTLNALETEAFDRGLGRML